MEIIQGKPKDKKIVIAQEIAFAKALAGNNKTLRDRALKKLKKWLRVRGTGKWTFTEEEFLRIWTGLFYCMWMSDKFLIQEELAESISSLIHCFKKNSESALQFIKCFNQRILLDWEGLDQYRIDKFNMLVRRFLRQTFVYIREKNWDEILLRKLMEIYYNVVLHSDNALGFVLHFISIYPEELAKVSKGKLSTSTVLIFIEPFVKLLARSKDGRIQKEAEDFFVYLMKQTDTGIDFEEKFNAWREQGFPGDGLHCMKTININNKNHENADKSVCKEAEEEEDSNEDVDDDYDQFDDQNQPLDPRAGSVHVYLPQIPIDLDGIIDLFRKHQNSKQATNKGRKILKSLTQKYGALKQGKFPIKIKKDPVLSENLKKKKLAFKNARNLIEFTQEINEGPIMTKEFCDISRELEENNSSHSQNNNEEFKTRNIETEDVIDKQIMQPKKLFQKINSKTVKRKHKCMKIDSSMKEKKTLKKLKMSEELMQDIKENTNHKESSKPRKKKNKKLKNFVGKGKNLEGSTSVDEGVVKKKKAIKMNGTNKLHEKCNKDFESVVRGSKIKRERKILSNWQVQELDSNSPEYYNIKTPKIIRLEKKVTKSCDENGVKEPEETLEENELKNEKASAEKIVPLFWEKARQKVIKKSRSKSKIFLNPFAKLESEFKASGRRISFALDRNMAQENEQYLKEVKNSPRVPFDGSKKPVQSALKSGLAPSPVNPFYRFKKIKF